MIHVSYGRPEDPQETERWEAMKTPPATRGRDTASAEGASTRRPAPLWTRQDEPPTVKITRRGRWMHTVIIQHGLMQHGPNGGPWFVLGARRARRKAARVLRAYLLDQHRQATPTIMRAEDL